MNFAYLLDFGPNVEPDDSEWPECLPAFRKFQPVIDWAAPVRVLTIPEDRL